MPRILSDFEAPARVPEVGWTWWRDQFPPWTLHVSEMGVDLERTVAFHRLPVAARVRTAGRVPLQVGASGTTTTVTFRSGVPTGVHRVPFPQAVWVIGNSDRQWFGIDLGRRRYWEVSAVRSSLWGMSAQRVVLWELDGPWDQVRGIVGAGVPMWSMVPTLFDLRSGWLAHALHFVVAGDYSPELSPLGSELGGKTDGTQAGHPLRAGERLRLSESARARLLRDHARTMDDHAVIWALSNHGAIVTDKTTAEVGHNLRLPAGCNVTVELSAADFEVLAQ